MIFVLAERYTFSVKPGEYEDKKSKIRRILGNGCGTTVAETKYMRKNTPRHLPVIAEI